ncbi:synaptotagmin-like protein 2 isoform X1 [Poeciliopsis prolifica]|uniref:synaptotagmin-like protein 2 isoform X1 n=1 Tax=Poeciliopsis prolifica TaxID=188132 RepID=UPI002413D1D0|nr:synaptotagmin-like protein 2 isoform X1 [Poeciliopsis prolifica]XP_054879424.1 synaptotagmin-like protein 2 isoform X1 [Poeciliopsis prolifica]
MIDLGFLTDEEKKTIMSVLKRDAELKKAEEKRVQNLQRTVADKIQLKYLTGEWFYETKQLRHQECVHAPEVIRASMRHTSKTLTIDEISHIMSEKSSFVTSEKREAFDLPALCSEEPKLELNTDGHEIDHFYKTLSDAPTVVSSARMKVRRNPFNSEQIFEENKIQLLDEATALTLSQNQIVSEQSDPEPLVLDSTLVAHVQPTYVLAAHDPDKHVQGHIKSEEDCHCSSEARHNIYSLETSSQSCAENPITSALAQLSSRVISSSKSLENFTSEKIQVLSNSTAMKSSFSVHSLQQQKTDYDSPSRSTWSSRINANSSNSSLSSAMASISSMSSSISTIDPLDMEVQGSIQFAVNYIQKIEEFQVFVVKCSGLAVTETKKNYDLYVKCYLVPDNTRLGKRKTTVKKKTFHPTYNEVLKFKISLEELKKQILNVSVWHNDLFGRNDFLGDVDLDLSEWDIDNTEINEYALKAKVPAEIFEQLPSNLKENGGKMRVALKFVSQTIKGKGNKRGEAGELLIWVKDCKDLCPVIGVNINPLLKCTVLPDTSRKNRQKTRVVKRTANPLFNHTMMYDGFRLEDLGEACAEITVWNHNRLQNHFIGGVRLGPGTGKSYGVEVAWMDSTTTEANLWCKMLQSNGEWVEDILPLRMLVMAKSMSA